MRQQSHSAFIAIRGLQFHNRRNEDRVLGLHAIQRERAGLAVQVEEIAEQRGRLQLQALVAAGNQRGMERIAAAG
ncbi:MAG: hypothetical protein NTW86_23395, partial [Candidatus Sumerlaeota bacterium]|nr:hypothetical protein [Candidatus Sumerlaeota bacterium]